MKVFINEFKSFVARGNVIDLAVGVVIGGAFGKIVTSLVNDILMPIIGMIIGAVNFTELKFVLSKAVGDQPEVAIRYGAFIQSAIDFLIIAFSIFIFIKMLGKLNRRKQEDVEEIPALEADSNEVEITKSEVLLEEIRDLLKIRTEQE